MVCTQFSFIDINLFVFIYLFWTKSYSAAAAPLIYWPDLISFDPATQTPQTAAEDKHELVKSSAHTAFMDQ